MAITSSEMKPTKDNAGAYLELVFTVMDGEHQGRKVWERLNVQNNNAQAVEIAQKQLSAICHCVGVFQVSDTSQLHNIPLQVKIAVQNGQDGSKQNAIKGYKDMQGNDPGASQNQGGQAPAAGNQPAWGGNQGNTPAVPENPSAEQSPIMLQMTEKANGVAMEKFMVRNEMQGLA
ncbi:MAG: DUF669 domain-containing protein [Pseudomonadales bacterium]|nr:DUF669 domain-containing protein [Pseudomonadales bacterium]